MEKLYDRIYWENGTTPALNDSNLNAVSKAIDDIDDRVIELADDVFVIVPQIQAYLDQADSLVEALETLSQNPPYIGANGNWWVWDTATSQFVDSGVDASITVDIEDITMIPYGQTPYVTNSGTNTDPVFHLFIPLAATVASVEKTSTVGLVDTYTMTLQDGSTFTFEVHNGGGSGDMRAQVYDENGDVAAAGGIEDYVSDQLSDSIKDGVLTIQRNGVDVETFSANSASNKTINIVDDDWIATATVQSGNVSFSGIDDTQNRAYDPWFEVDDNSLNKNPCKRLVSVSGAGTNNMSIVYSTDADANSTVKLRVIQ